MSKKHVNIPIFIPHKGCRYDCAFCNQKKISGQMTEMTENKMESIIQDHIKTVAEDSFVEIAFFGGSFTGIEKERQIEYLKLANEYIDKGFVKEIRISTRPDYINNEILEYLAKYNVGTIELGAQSLDELVLKGSNRGHDVYDVYYSSNLIKQKGFRLGIQTMVGLPCDTFEKSINTAKKIVLLKPDFVRIYPALVIKGTELERMYVNKEYKPLKLEDAVELCSQILSIYDKHKIKVIRVGLMPTDNIAEGKDVVSGPFHPAFRQLVTSRQVLKSIEKEILERKLFKNENLEIISTEKNISNLVGHKSANIKYLKSKYKFKFINIKSEKEVLTAEGYFIK